MSDSEKSRGVAPNPALKCFTAEPVDGSSKQPKVICIPQTEADATDVSNSKVQTSTTTPDEYVSNDDVPVIVIKGKPGQLENGKVCSLVELLSTQKKNKAQEGIFDLIKKREWMKSLGWVFDHTITPLAQLIAWPSDGILSGINWADKKVVTNVGSWVGLNKKELEEQRQSWESWGTRAGLATTAATGYFLQKALKDPRVNGFSSVAKSTAAGFGGMLKNHWDVPLSVWAISSGVLKSTENVTHYIPGVKDLKGSQREVADMAVGSSIVALSMAIVNHEYSTYYFNPKKARVVELEAALAKQGLDQATQKVLKKELASLVRLPMRQSLKWALGWTLYYTYTRIVTDQSRALEIIDGESDWKTYVPGWKWKWDYFNPDLWTNYFSTWMGTAAPWAMAASRTVPITDRLNNFIFRNGGKKEIMTFTAGEKEVLSALGKAMDGNKKFSWEWLAKRVESYQQAAHYTFKGARGRYMGIMFGVGAMISTILSRLQQATRGFEDPDVLNRTAVRTVFNRGLNTVVIAPSLTTATMPVSNYEYFFAGMGAVMGPYEICNEREEAFSQLALTTMRKYQKTEPSDKKRRTELAVQMRTFEAASLDAERESITKLLDENHIPVFKVVYESPEVARMEMGAEHAYVGEERTDEESVMSQRIASEVNAAVDQMSDEEVDAMVGMIGGGDER